jgi:hypothetical protein
MSQKQGQYLGLVYELSAESCLHLGGSEQKLVTAWQIRPCTYTTLLILSTSALTSLVVLAAHLDKWTRKAKDE